MKYSLKSRRIHLSGLKLGLEQSKGELKKGQATKGAGRMPWH